MWGFFYIHGKMGRGTPLTRFTDVLQCTISLIMHVCQARATTRGKQSNTPQHYVLLHCHSGSDVELQKGESLFSWICVFTPKYTSCICHTVYYLIWLVQNFTLSFRERTRERCMTQGMSCRHPRRVPRLPWH